MFNLRSNKRILSSILTMVLILLLVFPTAAFAEGDEPATEPAAGEPVVEAVEAPAETPADEPAVTEVVAEGEVLPDPAVTTTTETYLSEVVEALDEADLVMVNSDGEQLSLASEEAVAAISAPDPYLVRGGTTYRFLTDCTPFGGVSATCTESTNPIQSAIDYAVAGEVIYVEAGVYKPDATIWINKSLTLLGPQANNDPRPSFGTTRAPGAATEAIVDGNNTLNTIFRINANNVEINGFEFRNAKGDMVYSQAASGQTSAFSNIYFGYNILQNSGDEAIQLKDVNNSVIEYNYVFNTSGDALNIASILPGSDNNIIQHNEARDIGSSDGAIYVYGTTNTTIQYNIIYNIINNDGIKMGNKGGADQAKPGGAILCNTIDNVRQDGISVYMSDVNVSCNEVSRSKSENGAIYVAFNANNVLVENNYIHDNGLSNSLKGPTYGIRVGWGITGHIPTNVVLANNNLVNNEAGLFYKHSGGTDLLAINNWWGAANGPSGAGSGSGNTVTTMVNFNPWLTETFDICPNLGGVQTCLPLGMELNPSGNCVTPSDTPSDLEPTVVIAPAATVVFLPAGPLPLIPVIGGELVALSGDIANTLQLPDGNAVIFNQVMAGYEASLAAEIEETLPGTLPAGSAFAAGITLNLFKDGVALDKLESGTLSVSFVIPAGMEAAEFSILYWDAEALEWVEISAISVVDGFVIATVDFPGTFVLVTK